MFLRAELKNIFKSAVIIAPVSLATYFSFQSNPVLGTAFFSTAFIYAKIRNRLRTRGVPLTELQKRIDVYAKEMGIKKKIRALKSSEKGINAFASNVSIKFSEGVIIHLDEDAQEQMMRHELWHIKRRDGLPIISHHYASDFAMATLSLSVAPIVIENVSVWSESQKSLSFAHDFGLNMFSLIEKNNDLLPFAYSNGLYFLAALFVSQYVVSKKLLNESKEENHEKEFDCDRAAAYFSGSPENGVKLINSILAYKNGRLYLDSSHTHPSYQARVESLQNLPTSFKKG